MSAFAFDREGRLWATTSAATDHTRDGVYLVAQAGATPLKVISGLEAPLGLTWAGDMLYVASIGRVDAFGGLDGTRFTRHRTILAGPVANGWNNNLVQAPDGRLVTSVSAPCDHCAPTSKWYATIVSFRPDGSDLRVVASGVRAAFGLAYYPGTSELFATLNQRDDLGAATPGDWLALIQQGQDWGFPRCYGQDSADCDGVPDPVAVLDAHAAAGGVAIVTGELGPVVATAALVAEWKLGRVERIELTEGASGYTGEVEPFLAGLKSPLPVAATGDGAVLVGDWSTGVVYRISER